MTDTIAKNDTIAKVVKTDIDALNATLTVTIEKADYEPLLNAELKKYRKQATFKGFRQGKTPLSFIKKMYGKQLLSDIINKELQTGLGEFFQNDESNYVGNPISNEDSPGLDWNIKDLQDYTFIFDVGMGPEFEIKGLSSSDSFEKYVIDIPAKDIDEEFENARKREGERILAEDKIQDNDVVKLSVKELDGKELKEGGVESEFSVLTSQIDNEKFKKELMKKKVGATLKVNVFEIEDAKDDNHAKKYFLNLEGDDLEKEVGPFFEATITEVSRVNPAEVNQEFFDKMFGPDAVKTEEEAKAKLKEIISGQYNSQTEAVLFRNVQDELLTANKENIPLPDVFLKRWLVQASEANTPEAVERDYDGFVQNLRWSLIKSKFAKDQELKVEEQDIKNHIGSQMMQYLSQMGGQLGDMSSFMDSMIERAMGDEKQVRQAAEAVMDNKLFDKIMEIVTIQENSVTPEEFNKVVDDIKAADEAERAAAEAIAAAEAGEEEE